MMAMPYAVASYECGRSAVTVELQELPQPDC